MASLNAKVIWSEDLTDGIYIPKYYAKDIERQFEELSLTHDVYTLGYLMDEGVISASTGHEIGKAAYGTGDIPFIRTSDMSNWELKTVPKQGVSKEIYNEYSKRQAVRVGDILFVRDGTYLIGRNCIITEVDREVLFQSHVLKFSVLRPDLVDPYLLFLALNSPLTQRHIRSKQFTADIIDTLGQRVREIKIAIPHDGCARARLIEETSAALRTRRDGKLLIKHFQTLMEESLREGTVGPFEKFSKLTTEEQLAELKSSTISNELGSFSATVMPSTAVVNSIYIPKYYDRAIGTELDSLSENCDLVSIGELIDRRLLLAGSGVEPGKSAYGTGEIPFVRTSDFTNWELAAESKQGVSEDIYDMYAGKAATQPGDVLLVRDGTYLVGSSCIVTESDPRSIFCGGLIRLRSLDQAYLDPMLLLGLLNTVIVKKQFRSKQFTRDVIDTMGQRYREVVLPIPKNPKFREQLSNIAREAVLSRVSGRTELVRLTQEVIAVD